MMIPASPTVAPADKTTVNSEILPTKTYRLDPVNGRIVGMVDGREAVMQFIEKVMSTDKYAFKIYDWYYGNDLRKLVGQPYDYVVTRIPNIFREALLVDDRILDVRDFTFVRPTIDSIRVSCYVDTVYGDIKYERKVLI